MQGNLTNKLSVSETPYTMNDVVDGQLAAEKIASTPAPTGATLVALQALVAKGTITVKVGENTATPRSAASWPASGALSKTLPNASRQYDQVATHAGAEGQPAADHERRIDGNGATISSTPGTPAGSIAGTELFGSNTPGYFSTRITAGGITLNDAVTGNTLVLGMAANGAKDGSVAVKIAAIGTTKADPTSTRPIAKLDAPDRMWASYVSDLGARSSSAEARTSAAQAVLTSLHRRPAGRRRRLARRGERRPHRRPARLPGRCPGADRGRRDARHPHQQDRTRGEVTR